MMVGQRRHFVCVDIIEVPTPYYLLVNRKQNVVRILSYEM